MELPQYEKDQLLDAVLNIDAGLIYLQNQLQQRLGSFNRLEDAIRKTGRHDINDQLNEILNDFHDTIKGQIRDLREHVNRAREVTDAIRNGVFG